MYRSRHKCSDCKHEFERTTKNYPRKDPPCPNCKKRERIKFRSSISDKTHNLFDTVQEMNESHKAPSVGGANLKNKAIDITAEMVMQDYKMTDINMDSSLREGDNCVPKLPPGLEQKVDQVFKPQKPIMGQQAATTVNKAIMRGINAGAFITQGMSNDVVARQQRSGVKIPTSIIAEHTGKPN